MKFFQNIGIKIKHLGKLLELYLDKSKGIWISESGEYKKKGESSLITHPGRYMYTIGAVFETEYI